jgi:hypothetical protein
MRRWPRCAASGAGAHRGEQRRRERAGTVRRPDAWRPPSGHVCPRAGHCANRSSLMSCARSASVAIVRTADTSVRNPDAGVACFFCAAWLVAAAIGIAFLSPARRPDEAAARIEHIIRPPGSDSTAIEHPLLLRQGCPWAVCQGCPWAEVSGMSVLEHDNPRCGLAAPARRSERPLASAARGGPLPHKLPRRCPGAHPRPSWPRPDSLARRQPPFARGRSIVPRL